MGNKKMLTEEEKAHEEYCVSECRLLSGYLASKSVDNGLIINMISPAFPIKYSWNLKKKVYPGNHMLTETSCDKHAP